MTRYTDEQVDAILRRALERNDGLAHEDLVAAAAEVGISREDIDAAAEELSQQDGDGVRARDEQEERKLAFRRRALKFGVINVFLFLINMLAGGATWFYWPLLASAFLLAMQWTKLSDPPKKKKKSKKQRRRERHAAQKRARVQEKRERKVRTKEATRRFENAIEEGVASLLHAAAARVESQLKPAPKAPTDFQRYVDGEPSASPAAQPKAAADSSVRARVPELDDEYSEEELAEAEREMESFL